MKIARRSLLKSMLAGGALAGFGLPRLSLAASPRRESREVVLLTLGEAGVFAQGAHSAGPLDEFSLGAGLPDATAVKALFKTQRGKRLIGLMSDGAYVLFAEMARDAGALQYLEGHHSAAINGSTSRHALQSVAGFHGAAEPLAAGLAVSGKRFAMTEAPLLAADTLALRGGDWSAHGFSSYRVRADKGQGGVWLHLAGLGVAQGCAALDVDPRQAEPLRCWRSYVPPAADAEAGWEAALGQTLARLAGGGENHAPCVNQAFVHQYHLLDEDVAHHSHVSFVMEA